MLESNIKKKKLLFINISLSSSFPQTFQKFRRIVKSLLKTKLKKKWNEFKNIKIE